MSHPQLSVVVPVFNERDNVQPLIDEITAVGDHRFREKCQVELYEKRAHKTWVLVSHDAHYVRQHCTHACVIEKGKLQVAATVEEAIQIYEALP